MPNINDSIISQYVFPKPFSIIKNMHVVTQILYNKCIFLLIRKVKRNSIINIDFSILWYNETLYSVFILHNCNHLLG